MNSDLDDIYEKKRELGMVTGQRYTGNFQGLNSRASNSPGHQMNVGSDEEILLEREKMWLHHQWLDNQYVTPQLKFVDQQP